MSQLLVCGLNYHSSPIAVREKIAIPPQCLQHAFSFLSNMPHVKESVILSTCNRMEVYAVVDDVPAGCCELETFFAAVGSISGHGVLRPNFRLLGEDVALHLFRVAAGLDSMVLGEAEILGQVKAAHLAALEAKTSGNVLNNLFNLAINCGKRVRTETAIGARSVSFSSAALDLARRAVGSLCGKNVVVIGAGRMAHLCLKQLLSDGSAQTVLAANRDRGRLETLLATASQGKAKIPVVCDFDDRHAAAAIADVVIVATSAPDYVLNRAQLYACRPDNGKDLCILDLSVPRNVDPKVSELPGVRLFHVDDLIHVVENNLAQRQALTADAERIVFDKLEDFRCWQRTVRVLPLINDLRTKLESICQEQTEKALAKPRNAQDTTAEAEIEGLSKSIISRILHDPTVRLKATSDEITLTKQTEALRILFDLNSKN
ncbi:MAG TPA: glutamyl-tRNA reductase [Candidatus Obscuribacterales bacterium]